MNMIFAPVVLSSSAVDMKKTTTMRTIKVTILLVLLNNRPLR